MDKQEEEDNSPQNFTKDPFNRQEEVNIIDEIREIINVNVNRYHQGDTDGQKNGTILSIYFKNAYMSTYLRLVNLVMKSMRIPEEFITWFWMMYKNLGIVIVIKQCKSEKIKAERGFMEGHPQSMAAFVVSIIPLMNNV